MANQKHLHFRNNILDNCFRRRNNPLSFEELLLEVNEKLAEVYPGESISVRTLRKDIATFRDKVNGFGAELKTMDDNGKIVYLYADPNFSIAQKPLLADEQYIFDAAQQLLERFENHPKYDKISEALVLFQEEESSNTIPDYQNILFYKNEAYEGLRLLKPFFLAIKNKKVLKIKFRGFLDLDEKEFVFHPYVLKQYNQRWFVFGYNETMDTDHWSIPLDDRLESFTPEDAAVYRDDETDWNRFFNEMVGVRRQSLTQDEPMVEKVVLRFTPQRLHYFKTKPLHPYWDEFVEAGRENDVFFEAIVNLELVQQILSYGKDVEVLEPEELRDKVKGEIELSCQIYNLNE